MREGSFWACDFCVQSPATAQCLVIVGLPASGKTSYERSLLEGRSHYEDVHHWPYYRDQHIQAGDDRFGRFLSDLQERAEAKAHDGTVALGAW